MRNWKEAWPKLNERFAKIIRDFIEEAAETGNTEALAENLVEIVYEETFGVDEEWVSLVPYEPGYYWACPLYGKKHPFLIEVRGSGEDCQWRQPCDVYWRDPIILKGDHVFAGPLTAPELRDEEMKDVE